MGRGVVKERVDRRDVGVARCDVGVVREVWVWLGVARCDVGVARCALGMVREMWAWPGVSWVWTGVPCV